VPAAALSHLLLLRACMLSATRLREALQGCDVDTGLLKEVEGPCGTAVILLEEGGERKQGCDRGRRAQRNGERGGKGNESSRPSCCGGATCEWYAAQLAGSTSLTHGMQSSCRTLAVCTIIANRSTSLPPNNQSLPC
jgi:hypothetical protein